MDRRHFLSHGAKSLAMFYAGSQLYPSIVNNTCEELKNFEGSSEEIAQNENYWYHVQQAFMVDRSLVNLNNGGCSPCPSVAQDALKRYLDYSNTAPVYAMWRILEPEKEGIRQQLARLFKCSSEEIAITRNASEGLQICQMGFDLKKGDEILGTTLDYPRMVATFQQRQKREGIVYKTFKIPVPCDNLNDIVDLYKQNITKKTKLILVTHMINYNGQITPVKEICRLGRERGIPVIVDGAHSFAQFPFTAEDLECDYFATSLHKWLLAPIGAGFLFVRKNKIKDLWPLQAAWDTQKEDIRKFEEIGTHPAGNILAIAEAINFHLGMTVENKSARLCYLRDRWAKELVKYENVQLFTSLKEHHAYGLALVNIKGIRPDQLANALWDKYRILVVAINHEELQGIRVTANVYTSIDEIDRFKEAMIHFIKNGV